MPVEALGECLDAVVDQVQQGRPYVGVDLQQVLAGLLSEVGVVAELDRHAVVLLVLCTYSTQVRARLLPVAKSPSLLPKAFSMPVTRG